MVRISVKLANGIAGKLLAALNNEGSNRGTGGAKTMDPFDLQSLNHLLICDLICVQAQSEKTVPELAIGG